MKIHWYPFLLLLPLAVGCTSGSGLTAFDTLVDDLDEDITQMQLVMDDHETHIEGCVGMSDVMTEENDHAGMLEDMLDHMSGLVDEMTECDSDGHMHDHLGPMDSMIDDMYDEMAQHHDDMMGAGDMPAAVMYEHEHHDHMDAMLDFMLEHHDGMHDADDDIDV